MRQSRREIGLESEHEYKKLAIALTGAVLNRLTLTFRAVALLKYEK